MGGAIGAAIGLLVVFGGDPDYRDQGGWGASACMAGVGALVGVVNVAAAAVWLELGVVDGIARDDWMWLYPTCVAAVVAAIIAAIAAEALLARAERREREVALEP